MPEKPVDMRVSYVEHLKNMEVVYSLINQRVVKKTKEKNANVNRIRVMKLAFAPNADNQPKTIVETKSTKSKQDMSTSYSAFHKNKRFHHKNPVLPA
jgi:hypothetical protein